jgi:hypothetical protein
LRRLRLNRAADIQFLGHLSLVGRLLCQFQGFRQHQDGRGLEIGKNLGPVSVYPYVGSKDQERDKQQVHEQGTDGIAREASRRNWLGPGSEEIQVAGFD